MKWLLVFHHLNLFNQNFFDEIFDHLKLIYSLTDMYLFPQLFYNINNVKAM